LVKRSDAGTCDKDTLVWGHSEAQRVATDAGQRPLDAVVTMQDLTKSAS
jgi:hypothetical protein